MSNSWRIASLVLLLSAFHWPAVAAQRGMCHACPGYPIQYQQGALLLEVTGPMYNIVEAYFGDLAYRKDIPGASNLHANRVFLSPGSQGLFVVRHGADNDQIMLIGWKSDRYVQIDGNSDGQKIGKQLGGSGVIHVSWKSPTIVRLSCGNGVERTCILRWRQDQTQWQMFDENSGTWSEIKP